MLHSNCKLTSATVVVSAMETGRAAALAPCPVLVSVLNRNVIPPIRGRSSLLLLCLARRGLSVLLLPAGRLPFALFRIKQNMNLCCRTIRWIHICHSSRFSASNPTCNFFNIAIIIIDCADLPPKFTSSILEKWELTIYYILKNVMNS